MAERRQNTYFSGSRDFTDLVGLGNFIRTRRQTITLTQEQLADRLGWVQERIQTQGSLTQVCLLQPSVNTAQNSDDSTSGISISLAAQVPLTNESGRPCKAH